MRSASDGESRLLFWRRVREFAVPPSMIESVTARRRVGDWAAACAAARVDVDLSLRAVARAHGGEIAALVRADLRHLAPDLLRWHLPRIAPDGLLRPGLTISLSRYAGSKVQLVARTPPGWADGGQRFSLAVWDGAGAEPHPDRRFRLDLHRHLWDARRSAELRDRSAGCWPAEARILLGGDGVFVVRAGARRRVTLELSAGGIRRVPDSAARVPMLPDAATWVAPDRALLRAGLISPDLLHPLVAAALAPDHVRKPAAAGTSGPRPVRCRGAEHRIGLVGGVLAPLDHSADEIRREELLVALSGTPLPCLQAIDAAHRSPESLVDVRARLDHGDAAGALAVVEDLLGPGALLRSGALHDELETAAQRRVAYGLFRSGLAGVGLKTPARARRPRNMRSHPRHTMAR